MGNFFPKGEKRASMGQIFFRAKRNSQMEAPSRVAGGLPGVMKLGQKEDAGEEDEEKKKGH